MPDQLIKYCANDACGRANDNCALVCFDCKGTEFSEPFSVPQNIRPTEKTSAWIKEQVSKLDNNPLIQSKTERNRLQPFRAQLPIQKNRQVR